MSSKLIDKLDDIKKEVLENGIYVSENFLNENENESLKRDIIENSYSKFDNHENTYISNIDYDIFIFWM